MEDFNFTNISQDLSYDYDNITPDYYDYSSFEQEYDRRNRFIVDVVLCIIISAGLPLTLVVIYALFSLVRNDNVAPIYIINLLISDLIQFCCMMVEVTHLADETMETNIHLYSLIASIGFMVCVALERYLVIACPLWYRFRRTMKISLVVSVVVWVIPPVFLLTLPLWVDHEVHSIIMGVFFLLPFPLLIFFLGGTLKALSASRVPSDEKSRIIGILVLVLLIYTLLFVPCIIWYLSDIEDATFYNSASIFVSLSPLADLLMYVIMRKGTIDKLLASLCRCTMDSNDNSRMDRNDVIRMDGNLISRVDTNNVSRLDTNDVSRMDSNDVSRVDGNLISRVDTNDVSRLDTNDVSSVESNDVSRMDTNVVSRLDTNDVSSVESNDISIMDTNDVSRLDTNVISSVESNDVSRMDTNDVSRLDTNVISSVESNDVSRMDTNDVSRLDTNVISSVESNDVSRMDSNDSSRIESNDVIRMNTNDISRLDSNDISRLDTNDVSRLDSNDISRLDTNDVSRRNSNDVSRLDTNDVSRLDSNCQSSNMTDNNIYTVTFL